MRHRRRKPKEDWEVLEDLMRGPIVDPREEVIRLAPRDVVTLAGYSPHYLNELADLLKVAPKATGYEASPKLKAQRDRDRAAFLVAPSSEKALKIIQALQQLDWKAKYDRFAGAARSPI